MQQEMYRKKKKLLTVEVFGSSSSGYLGVLGLAPENDKQISTSFQHLNHKFETEVSTSCLRTSFQKHSRIFKYSTKIKDPVIFNIKGSIESLVCLFSQAKLSTRMSDLFKLNTFPINPLFKHAYNKTQYNQ